LVVDTLGYQVEIWGERRKMMAESKKDLRARYRRDRKQQYIPATFRHLLGAPEFQSARCVTSYLSISDEPSTELINRGLLENGVTLLLPRVSGKELQWVEWNGDTSKIKETKGLLEPIGAQREDISDVDVVIVPALHIDQAGYRLGQGGGFYDRSLPSMPGWKVGLVYAGELSSTSLPIESHDIPLDAAATPNLIVRFAR
jgi:5-formyltetrahydrofolate cyclo-ligase